MPIYLQHGNLIDYVPPTDTSTEDVVFMGGLVGIPQTFIPAGELGALSVDGVYIFNKKDGVSVNLGDVVKYCGTTKLAQDSDADLTLGVAVAEAEADDFGVKVKINSVLPSSGGGGGGEVALCGASGLYLNSNGEVTIRYCGNSAIKASEYDGVYLAVCGESGLSIQNGELVASGGGGGGGEVAIDTSRGLGYYTDCSIGINIGSGLSFGSYGELNANVSEVTVGRGIGFNGSGALEVKIANGEGLNFNGSGQLVGVKAGCGLEECSVSGSWYLNIKVCTASGLSIVDGYLTYTG